MTEVRADEQFVLQEGRELDELEELLLAVSEEGLPPGIKGNLILARTRAGKWRIRGGKGGVAEWDAETQWWRIRMACPACGSEWWDDEPAPRNPCCQSADFEGGEG